MNIRVLSLVSLATLCGISHVVASTISTSLQQRASFYKRDVIIESRLEGGINAPIPMFAAQIHQESLWHADAKSRYANGLTQFTPDTEAWIKTVFPKSLGDSGSHNPQWAIRAMIKYDYWLNKRITAIDNCNRWAMVLAAYNGGLGWINRDKKLAQNAGENPLIWWGNVENYSNRSNWAFKENRDYPKRIIYTHQPKYLDWGGSKVCL